MARQQKASPSPGAATPRRSDPSDRQLAGLDDGHLIDVSGGGRLHPAAATAFQALRAEARTAGFELAIASAWRGYGRQLAIWNGKLAGVRPVHNDRGEPITLASLPPPGQLAAVLRFSAVPGSSRHHWGTDLDIYDANALPAGQRPALTPVEVAPDGRFAALHGWLDRRMARGEAHGFFRPYATDRGGVAPERWHLSYGPLARRLAPRVTAAFLQWAWEEGGRPDRVETLLADLPTFMARYVTAPADHGSFA